jgi:hypothetical protein
MVINGNKILKTNWKTVFSETKERQRGEERRGGEGEGERRGRGRGPLGGVKWTYIFTTLRFLVFEKLWNHPQIVFRPDFSFKQDP